MAVGFKSKSTRLHFKDELTKIHVSHGNLLIKCVRLSHTDRMLGHQLFNVECRSGRVWRVTEASETPMIESDSWREVDGKEGLLIPS